MSSKYRVEFSNDAEKTLVKLDKPMIRRIFKALDLLCNDPFDAPNVKRMKGSEEQIFRLRVGNFRIIYEIKDKELIIYVVRVGPRGDVYK
ncbi:type II toxin-antitoxin system RelE/ParE family toxin [Paenibacillus sp. F411]|uniref:RelE/StbE family addiction module toxin n=1 Tax=Paenibacillus algicola TaxID=2565926 RepID=A0A4P8XFA8_9BACL|nr:type II toxin-antitoxin system RelE/ParE family toxin [Paenibacillus algicola]MBO2944424.1 type II toxin-antitoxin system RelE/ParE family toxin [Paenibacillus sp. F411]QCT01046.1 RelE/StbE family addiction module toxin [Paenibacillus algicola]